MLEYLFNKVAGLHNFIKKRLQHRREICEIFKNTFFTEQLRWLLLAMGAPYLVKALLQKHLKKLYYRKPFSEHILSQNVFQWLRIEKLKTTFHFLKEKKRKEND